MTPLIQFAKALRTDPFVPFRVRLLNGIAYDIQRSGDALATVDRVIIGVNFDPSVGMNADQVWVSPDEIASVEWTSDAAGSIRNGFGPSAS